ncbi:MAG: Cysteine synthase [Gemmatimonadaceae bacterium]|nr:Cysteine synthase [Gemmatimonadaceae bacterium]
MSVQSSSWQTRFAGLEKLVGNTPLLEIRLRYRGEPRVLFAKAESFNMTGSIKDRMALHVLERAYAEGTISPGDRIAEATSGNTGISFSAIGRALGHQVTIFMPDWMSRERIDLIRSFGAEIRMISREAGGFLGSIAAAEALAAEDRSVFLPRQFSNVANAEAHALHTGPELWSQLEAAGHRPAAFVAGVGTGGTVMGVAQAWRANDPRIRVHPLEPLESPTLTTGKKVGRHRIQGISDEFIPDLLKLDSLNEIVSVADGDAILMAQQLTSTLGLAVGISSGANLLGALMVQNSLGGDQVVATVFPDSNKKYLSTDLLREEPVKPDYLTPHVELTGAAVHGRMCAFCQ